MTEKEKAEAYDEAIERAKKLYGNGIIEEIFPELKESKDKKIREAILKGLIDCRDAPDLGWSNFGGIHIDDCIAWLEKQGEQSSSQTNERAWTIQDAKDGDVLVCDIDKAEIGGDVEKLPNIVSTIFIFKKLINIRNYIHSYCHLYDKRFLGLQRTMYYNSFVHNISPATKEQRDLLFQKIKEDGYEWDAENKELKKLVKY